MRFEAIESAQSRKQIDVKLPSSKISDYFAENVFTIDTMRHHLSKDAFISLMASIQSGNKIDRKIANQVAEAMKSWAMSKGATSYTHWFQPLTGATAEKHDTFFTPIDSGSGIETFSGNALVQQEPDGSSFPSGGLRATFEARGYTAWDPSSPAFIMSVGSHGKTLCIPTIFISYTGESLDYKAPLLKSQAFLEAAAVPVCQYFDRNVKRITPNLGWEQEYFLVDEALYYSRPDLVACGRTVLGAPAPKGQQLDDHYFGAIAERVYAFMLDFETEALKLGITISTRHNEVAPGQFECAPVYSEANVAVDQNQLLMNIMEHVARRHSLRVLFHEKPFAGVNGSGKHNNWSMSTDTGINLLSPGKTPKTNLQFLTFFINTIKAVNEHADILRASIASAGNDHRLGANEAPPAIISVFIGSTLTSILEEVEQTIKKGKVDEFSKDELKISIHKRIPDVMLDNTDRNRTSPFAFTGNKFEVRAVGSAANCAGPMTVLNTMVGQQLIEFKHEVDKLIKEEGEKKDGAILRVLRRYITDSKRILFEGDNYTDEWAKEAKKRGLSNVKDTPSALKFLITDKARKLFIENEIFSERELHARYDVLQEIYQMKIEIESKVMEEMVVNQIIPVAIEYQNELLTNAMAMQDLGLKKKQMKSQLDLIEKIADHINEMKKAVDEMAASREKADSNHDAPKHALAYCKDVSCHFDTIRSHADALESMVDNRIWPLPKYRELLFVR